MLLVVLPRPRYIIAFHKGELALTLSSIIHKLALVFAATREGKRTLALPFIVLPFTLIFVFICPDVGPKPMLQVIGIETEIVIATVLATSPDEPTGPMLGSVFESTFVSVATLVDYNSRPIKLLTDTVDEAFEFLNIAHNNCREKREFSFKAILRQGWHWKSF